MMERQVTRLVHGLNMETYSGHVRTPSDAIILFEACRIGLLPRVQRRLSEKERQSIKSGSVFVWDEHEAGMRRWTDGKSWSASRVSGSFLTYREMEGKRGGSGFSASAKRDRDGIKGNDNESADDGPDGYRYKPDGLMKQSFSIRTTTGQHLHLISYYARSTNTPQTLSQPSSDPQLRHIRPEKGMYPESTVQEQSSIPAVTRGPMTSPAFTPSTSSHPSVSVSSGSPYTRAGHHASPYASYGPPGWAPPSPMHTPPINQHYSPYYQHPGSHPPSGALGHSPLQHSQHAYRPHAQAYPPPLTAFDRPPAPLSNNGLPPPSSMQSQAPPYPFPSPYGHGLLPRPPYADHTTGHYSSGPPIDPKLSEPQGPRQDSAHSLKIDASAAAQRASSTTPQPPASSATTIPSISSLINATTQAPPSENSRGRTSSLSPGSRQQRQTQDIPLHKLGYDTHRDARALRDLDKATLRF